MIILRIANKIKFWRKPCLIRLLLNRYFLTRFVFYFELSVIKFGELKSLIFFSFLIKICLLLELMSNFVRRWDAELAVPSANAFANEVLTGPRSHYLENNANQTQRLSKFIFILQAARTAMSFLKISPAISSQEFISSWYPHWFSCFSRRIDLARFRFGTVISYRASYWDFSSVGRYWSKESWKTKNSFIFIQMVTRFPTFCFYLHLVPIRIDISAKKCSKINSQMKILSVDIIQLKLVANVSKIISQRINE